MKYYEFKEYLNNIINIELNKLEKNKSKLKILLVGAKGFIGSHLLEFFIPLLKRSAIEFEVYLMTKDKFFSYVLVNNKYHLEDIDNIPLGISHVIHLAVPSTPFALDNLGSDDIFSYFQTRERINYICSINKSKLIYFSSGAVFGRNSFEKKISTYQNSCIEKQYKEDPYTSLKILDESNFYLNSKANKFPLIIINLYNVLLPNQLKRPHFAVTQFISDAINSDQILVKSPKTLRSFIGIDEIIFSLLWSINYQESFVRFSLGSHHPISMIELAKIISEYYGGVDVKCSDLESSNISAYYPKDFEIHQSLLLLSKVPNADYIFGLLNEIKIEKKN